MIDGSVLQSAQQCFEKKSRVVVKMVVTTMGRCHWKLLLIASMFLTSAISTPIIDKIKNQLSQKGFGNDIASSNNFQRSLTCVKCGPDRKAGLDSGLDFGLTFIDLK